MNSFIGATFRFFEFIEGFHLKKAQIFFAPLLGFSSTGILYIMHVFVHFLSTTVKGDVDGDFLRGYFEIYLLRRRPLEYFKMYFITQTGVRNF